MRVTSQTAGRSYALLTILLLVVVAFSLIDAGAPTPVLARYGKRNYRAKYARYIARCKAGCNGKSKVIRACIAREQKLATKNCKAVSKADRALCTDGACKASVKASLKLCITSARNQAGHERRGGVGYGSRRCKTCCQQSRGEDGCLTNFTGSRFYDSYKYRGRLKCVTRTDGSPSPAFLENVSGRIRDRLAAWLPGLVEGWSE